MFFLSYPVPAKYGGEREGKNRKKRASLANLFASNNFSNTVVEGDPGEYNICNMPSQKRKECVMLSRITRPSPGYSDGKRILHYIHPFKNPRVPSWRLGPSQSTRHCKWMWNGEAIRVSNVKVRDINASFSVFFDYWGICRNNEVWHLTWENVLKLSYRYRCWQIPSNLLKNV